MVVTIMWAQFINQNTYMSIPAVNAESLQKSNGDKADAVKTLEQWSRFRRAVIYSMLPEKTDEKGQLYAISKSLQMEVIMEHIDLLPVRFEHKSELTIGVVRRGWIEQDNAYVEFQLNLNSALGSAMNEHLENGCSLDLALSRPMIRR